MAEAQNPEGQPQKQFDNENAKEAVGIGNQLKQTFKEASARANDFRFAMESSVSAATQLSKAAKLVAFDPDLEASFKIFQEDSKSVIKSFKAYPTLLEKAKKSNKGLADIEKIIQQTTQDTEGIRRSSDAANEVASAARSEQTIKELRLEETLEKLKEHSSVLEAAGNKEKEQSAILQEKVNALQDEKNKADLLSQQIVAAEALGDKDRVAELGKQLTLRHAAQESLQQEVVDQRAVVGLAQENLTKQTDIKDELEGQVKSTSEQIKKLGEVIKSSDDYTKSLVNSLETAEAFNAELQELKNQTADLNKATKYFGIASNLANAGIFKSLPLFSEMGDAFAKAEDSARQLHIDTDGAATGAATMAAAFNTIGSIAALAVFAKLVSAIGEASDRASDLGMQINISKNNAGALLRNYSDFAQASGQAYTSQKDFVAAQTELNQLLGISAAISAEQGASFSYMTERLGVSGASAAKLLKYTSAIGKNAQDFSEELVGQVQLFNTQNDQVISYSEVMEDIANTSARTRLTLSQFPGGITRAALQARNLGLTLDDIVGASESFLDFESSISAELEAELLTGKQLNLEQARLAALKGDTAKVAEEIAKQNITASDFAGMNVIQQEALAKAVGLSVDKLAESLENQEAQAAAAKETGKQLQAVFAAAQEDLKAEFNIESVSDLEKQLGEAKDLSKFQEQLNALSEAGATQALDSIYKQQKAALEKRINEEEGLTAAEKRQKIAEGTSDLTRKFGKSQKAIDDRNIANREKLAKLQERITDSFVELAVSFEPVIDQALTFAETLSTAKLPDWANSLLNPLDSLGVTDSDPNQANDTLLDAGTKLATAAAAGFGIYKVVKGITKLRKGELGTKNNPMSVRNVDGDGGSNVADEVGKVLTKKGPFKKLQQIANILKKGKGKLLTQKALPKLANLGKTLIPNLTKGLSNFKLPPGTASGLLKTVGGKILAPLEIAMGAFKGVSQVGKDVTAEQKKALGIREDITKTEAGILGALTGNANKGSVLSETVGIEQGSAGDEALGIAASGARGALTGAAIGSVIPVIGTAIGGAIGGIAGTLAESYKVFTDPNSELLKSFKSFGDKSKEAGSTTQITYIESRQEQSNEPEVKLAKGGIVTAETRATVGEAGAEAVVPLAEFYAKLDAMAASSKEQIKELKMLRDTVAQGGDVFIDGNKAGKALVLASTKMS